MKTLNNEITIQRNESFPLDKTIANKDGTPYVISCALRNPYFLVAVSSTRFNRDDRYMYNKWLSLEGFPMFLSTTPIKITDLIVGGNPLDFSSITSLSTIKYTGTTSSVTVGSVTYTVNELSSGEYSFKNGDNTYTSETIESKTIIVSGASYTCTHKVVLNYVTFYLNVSGTTMNVLSDEVLTSTDDGRIFYPIDGVFYKETEDGIDARYWKIGTGWTSYKCRIITQFETEITSDWVEQDYLYSITLVSGQDMSSYLQKAYTDTIGPLPEVWTLETLYDALVNAKYEFPKYFKFDNGRALATFDMTIPMLKPTKLTVRADLHGGL